MVDGQRLRLTSTVQRHVYRERPFLKGFLLLLVLFLVGIPP